MRAIVGRLFEQHPIAPSHTIRTAALLDSDSHNLFYYKQLRSLLSTSFLTPLTMTITILREAPSTTEAVIRHTQENVTLHITPVSNLVQHPGTLYVAQE